jgi:hypothetical protein
MRWNSAGASSRSQRALRQIDATSGHWKRAPPDLGSWSVIFTRSAESSFPRTHPDRSRSTALLAKWRPRCKSGSVGDMARDRGPSSHAAQLLQGHLDNARGSGAAAGSSRMSTFGSWTASSRGTGAASCFGGKDQIFRATGSCNQLHHVAEDAVRDGDEGRTPREKGTPRPCQS